MSSKIVRLMTGRDLQESPQYFPGPVSYQKDAKFRPITARNFSDYQVLGADLDFTYAIDPQHTTGFVFTNDDVANPPSVGMVPVVYAALKDSNVQAYKQVYKLRIRQAFALKGVTTAWYLRYANKFGGIVSDFEHLEGGKRLWKGLVRTASEHGFKTSVADTRTGERFPIGPDTPDSFIWSLDAERRPIVLVLERV